MSLLSTIANAAANVVRQVQQQQQAQQTQQPAQCPAPTNPSTQQPTNIISQSSFQLSSTPLVNLTGETGFVLGPQEPATESGYQAGQYLMVTEAGDGVRLRADPATDGSQILELSANTPLEVTQPPPPDCGPAQQGDWVHVRTVDGQEGWVNVGDGWLQETDAQTFEDFEEYSDVYIDQFAAEAEVGGDGFNTNCGPASAVVAFRLQGLDIPPIDSIEHNGTDGADVQAMRYYMYNGLSGHEGQDGLYQGSYSESENSTETGFTGLENAVTKAGGTAQDLMDSNTTLEDGITNIYGALENGGTVVVSGTFVTDDYVHISDTTPEALCDRDTGLVYRDYNGDGQPDVDAAGQRIYELAEKEDLWPRGGHAERHLIAVVDTTPEGNFVIIDPADPGGAPRVVTPEQLMGFMEGNADAMAVYGPNADPGLQQPS